MQKGEGVMKGRRGIRVILAIMLFSMTAVFGGRAVLAAGHPYDRRDTVAKEDLLYRSGSAQ